MILLSKLTLKFLYVKNIAESARYFDPSMEAWWKHMGWKYRLKNQNMVAIQTIIVDQTNHRKLNAEKREKSKELNPEK